MTNSRKKKLCSECEYRLKVDGQWCCEQLYISKDNYETIEETIRLKLHENIESGCLIEEMESKEDEEET